MDSRKSKMFGTLALLPLALLFVGPSAAQNNDAGPDLVITEDTQLALEGKSGKSVLGSCQTADPLWLGKIAIKNIGSVTVEVNTEQEKTDRLSPATETQADDGPPHLRIYVPNNIELQTEARLTHELREFGQELLSVKIGEGQPKCRNYGPPPIFDSRLSGRRGRLPDSRGGHGPLRGYAWQIKQIQLALIGKGFSLRADADYGPATARAILAFVKSRGEIAPPGIHRKPLSPKTVDYLLDILGAESDTASTSTSTSTSTGGDDECIRGVNHVPVYIEIDPMRAIENENRANNRVQFTVEIDCSSVAR